jgi:hypothetical protein
MQYLIDNTSITELYYMEAPEGVSEPYHVFQDVSKAVLKEHLQTKEGVAIFQMRSNYKSDTMAQDIALDEELQELFSCNGVGDNFDLTSYNINELEYSNVVNIGDPYYTNVKQFDFKYRSI